jgi:hypothetical protein
VDQIKYADYRLNLHHSHGDRWVQFQPAEVLDSAEDDPERSWDAGTLYECPECGEQVRVDLDKDDHTPD